jgi:hypothetical protein
MSIHETRQFFEGFEILQTQWLFDFKFFQIMKTGQFLDPDFSNTWNQWLFEKSKNCPKTGFYRGKSVSVGRRNPKLVEVLIFYHNTNVGAGSPKDR